MPQHRLLSDDELKQLVADPNFNPDQHMKLLSPLEQGKVKEFMRDDTSMGRVEDMLAGVAKGAGDTVFNLGKMVHNTPVVGSVTDKLASLLGGDPQSAFAGKPADLEPTNTAQQIGKTGEQIGEFFLPTGDVKLPGMLKELLSKLPEGANVGGSLSNMMRGETIQQLMKMLPDSLAAPVLQRGAKGRIAGQAPSLATKATTVAGRSIGEGLGAGAISAVHGEQDPEHEAGIAASGPLIGAGAEGLTKAALGTPMGRTLVPILGGSAMMAGAGHLGGIPGLGASMGLYGLARKSIQKGIDDPQKVAAVASGGRKVIEGAARAGAAVDDSRPSRRKIRD